MKLKLVKESLDKHALRHYEIVKRSSAISGSTRKIDKIARNKEKRKSGPGCFNRNSRADRPDSIREINVCKRIPWILSWWKRVSPVGATEGKRGCAGVYSIVWRSVYTEKCTHALFAHADTPPFPPFPVVHGGRKRPRERRERNTVARNEPRRRERQLRGRRSQWLRWRSEGRWEEGKDRGGVVTPWSVYIYVLGIRRARLLSSFLSLSSRPQDGSGGGGGGSCFTLFDFFKIYPYRFLAKSLSGRNLRSSNNTGEASPAELHTRFGI